MQLIGCAMRCRMLQSVDEIVEANSRTSCNAKKRKGKSKNGKTRYSLEAQR